MTDPVLPRVYAVATAHLDTQWRWTIHHTILHYLPLTLAINFDYIERFPRYTFSFEGSFRYQLIQEYFPEQYARMKAYIATGRWRVCGSCVDAGDVNIVSPESLMRQILYGNGFFQREFGARSVDIFLPDCFGFGYALPSIAAHCGLKGFSTQKLTWGSAHGVPFPVGVWEGPDGNSIVASLNAHDYGSRPRTDLRDHPAVVDNLRVQSELCDVPVAMQYYGTGDRGGGPAEGAVEHVEHSVGSERGITVIHSGADQLFLDLTADEIARLPRYRGELLMKVHGTGCYTAQAAMKRWNRKNELLADAAERAAVLANHLGGLTYPRETLQEAWVRFLWHQFHDDLTGTSIPEAYTFSWNDEVVSHNQFATVQAAATGAVTRALDTRVEGIPLVVSNPVSADRRDVVTATVTFPDAPRAVRVYDGAGRETPSQILRRDGARVEIAFVAEVPSVGYAVYAARASASPCELPTELTVSPAGMENARYRVRFDEQGDVAELYDKQIGGNLLSAPLRLQMLRHDPLFWAAWEIPFASLTSEPYAVFGGPTEVRVVEQGPARVAVEVTRVCAGSTVTQRWSLTAGEGDLLACEMLIDWGTKETILKAAIPLATANPVATYDLGLGTIDRPNNTDSAHEVPAQQWVDLSTPGGECGVTLISDSRYGWDKPDDGTLRHTLIFSPGHDAHASGDRRILEFGLHRAGCAIAGHAGDWRQGDAPGRAMRFNQPMITFTAPSHDGVAGRALSFARLSTAQVAIRAIKMAEAGDEIIIRLQELHGRPVDDARVTFSSPVIAAREVNGAEDPLGAAPIIDGALVCNFTPYQPRSYAVTLAPASLLTPPACMPVALPYNTQITSMHGTTPRGAFDDAGHAIPGELWPAEITCAGITYRMGPRDGMNVVRCQGQSIALPGGVGDDLHLLVAATEDGAATFLVGDVAHTIPVQSLTGFIGQWDVAGKAAYVLPETTQAAYYLDVPANHAYQKSATVAWVGTHQHRADGVDLPYLYTYLFAHRLRVPKHATTLTLPDDPRIIVVAVTRARDANADAAPAVPLMDQPARGDGDPTLTVVRDIEHLPDLIASDVRWEPEAPAAGDEVTFYVTMTNVGEAATPAGLGLTANLAVHDQCWFYADTPPESIPPGASVEVRINPPEKPWIAEAGTYRLRARVNDWDRTLERDWVNNTLVRALYVADR